MTTHNDEKLTRLLQQAGPGSIPTLEPDPHLPGRIRAIARERAQVHAMKTHRWLPVSLAATALAVAIMTGGYLGYTAGTSIAAGSAQEVAQGDEATQGADAFWSAWSQEGFAEDLAIIETEGDEGR